MTFPCVCVLTVADGELPLSGSMWPTEPGQTRGQTLSHQVMSKPPSWGVGTGRRLREK